MTNKSTLIGFTKVFRQVDGPTIEKMSKALKKATGNVPRNFEERVVVGTGENDLGKDMKKIHYRDDSNRAQGGNSRSKAELCVSLAQIQVVKCKLK